MSSKYKWFRVNFPEGINLERLVEQNPFNKISDHGFVRPLDPDSSADYSFAWRDDIALANINAKGEMSYEKVKTVRYLDFTSIKKYGCVFIRHVNTLKGGNVFFSSLESMAGYGFTVQRLNFDTPPQSVFKGVDRFVLVSIKVIGVLSKSDVISRIELVCKNGLALEQVDLLKNIDYKIESASYEMFYKGLKGTFSYSDGGTVKIGGPLEPRLLALLEADLLKPSP